MSLFRPSPTCAAVADVYPWPWRPCPPRPERAGLRNIGGLMDGVDLTRDPRDEGLPSAGSQLVF